MLLILWSHYGGIAEIYFPPEVIINEPMDREECDIVSKVSKYFQDITFESQHIVSAVACKFAKTSSVCLYINDISLSNEIAKIILPSFRLALYSALIFSDHGILSLSVI